MSSLRSFWLATRPFAFTASVGPALIGTLAALLQERVCLDLLGGALVLLGVASAHAGANLINDYFDYRNGVDRKEASSASGAIMRGLLAPREVLIEAIFAWAIAGACAAYFVATTGTLLLPLVLLGFLCGLAYTAGPWPLKYHAMGEAAVFASFGIGIGTGAYVVQTHHYSWVPVFYCLPAAFLVMAILHGNNLRDTQSDEAARIKTLALTLGARVSAIFYVALLAAAYGSLVLLVGVGRMDPLCLIALASLPLSLRLCRDVLGALRPGPNRLLLIDAATARLHAAFDLLLGLGMAAGLLL